MNSPVEPQRPLSIFRDPESPAGEQRLFIRFLGIFLLLAGVLTAALALFSHLEQSDHLTRLQAEERHGIQMQEQIVGQRFDAIITDLLYLARQNELQHLLTETTPHNRQLLALEYQHFANTKTGYDQLRYIDANGMEIVRVNASPKGPIIVPERDLQNKGDRYYFKDSVGLRRGEIFVSPFDLNIEQGRLEMPFKPMIRFATPVFDQNGANQGIVIVNYLGKQLLESIRENARSLPGELILLNSDGYWLLAPDAADEWGFMFPEGKNRRFSIAHPEIWRMIQQTSTGQFNSPKGLFSFSTITPLSPRSPFTRYSLSSSGSPTATGTSNKALPPKDYYWKLVSHVHPRVLLARSQQRDANLFMLAIILYVLATLPAWFLAKALTNHALSQHRLYQMAHFDALTKLPNRALFLDRLNQTLRNAHRYQRRPSLIYVDLDDFKQVNDELGHEAGDLLLRETASRLRLCVRRSDTVGRMGGDEFTVLLTETEKADHAAVVAEKIMEALAAPFDLKGTERIVHASIGIAVYPDDGDEPDLLLRNADSAMYRAKQQRKNCYCFWDEGKAQADPT